MCLKDDAYTDSYTAFAPGELHATPPTVLCSVPLKHIIHENGKICGFRFHPYLCRCRTGMVIYMEFLINGNSMFPFLKNGDLIRIKTVTSLQLGDIVVFTAPNGKKIFHRVVLLKDEEVLCKGDNCLHFDRIEYDFGEQYHVLRHWMQKEFAKVSFCFGNLVYKHYQKDPIRFHKNTLLSSMIRVIYSLTMYLLYLLYMLGARRSFNG